MVEAPDVRDAGLLAASDGQHVYWEESGPAEGIPGLYLHGGPGGGLGEGGYRNKFDGDRFRIIAFEQRGCGRSTPLATDAAHRLDDNTTQRLILDIEELRAHLGVERWVVNGVSWGSTLALAYAQAHPGRVAGIVLMAVTTTSREEVDWITETVGAVFPEAWDRLAAHAEAAGIGYRRGQSRLVAAYARLLRDPDPTVRRAAAMAWAEWEDTHISIGTGGVHRDPRWDDPVFTEVFATLVTHYWAHDGFLSPPLLDRMDRLAGITGTLVHGRRDVSGPVITAWNVHRRWPGSRLVIDEGEGHGGVSMVQAWRDANASMADALQA